MPEWDAQAVDHAKKAPTWWAWCDRQGWDYRDPYMHRYWSRKQFAVALKRIPKEHPDRWKYEIGARFADPAQSIWIPIAIFASVAVIVFSIPLSVTTGFPFWAVAVPLVFLGWFIEWRNRVRALST